jgi:3,4-dihydroxy 2-butanone 4-phosphate synthase / GTP cyclohydrolase II
MFDYDGGVTFEAVEQAACELRRGSVVILRMRDGTARLLMAAEHATASRIAFYVRHTSGLIAVALPADRCDELDLPPMVTGDSCTVFAVAVDAAAGISTGISAIDRAVTIRALALCGAKTTDFRRPGHVLVLRARSRGLLEHLGEAESAIDLCRMAGLRQAGAVADLLSQDGDVACGAAVDRFAAEHGLVMVSVDQIVAFRRRFDRQVERVTECRLPLQTGHFRAVGYRCVTNGTQHLAVVAGNPADQLNPLVRVHRECVVGDVFGAMTCQCHARLQESLHQIAASGYGVVVYLRGDLGWGTDVGSCAGAKRRENDFSVSAAILRDLGVQRFRALVARSIPGSAASELGLEIVECVPFSGNHDARRLIPS